MLQANLNVIDNDTLKFKYDEALNKNRPYINHEFVLEDGKYMELTIGDTKAVIMPINPAKTGGNYIFSGEKE